MKTVVIAKFLCENKTVRERTTVQKAKLPSKLLQYYKVNSG